MVERFRYIVHCEQEREDSHVLGIWIRYIVPSALVVPGEVLLDCAPVRPDWSHDPPVQLQALANTCILRAWADTAIL